MPCRWPINIALVAFVWAEVTLNFETCTGYALGADRVALRNTLIAGAPGRSARS